MAVKPFLPRRRTIRFQNFDYSQAACYFVTICSKDNRCIFGHVVAARMQLSDLGRIVEECLVAVPRHFKNADIPVHSIMPNHLHAVVALRVEASSAPPTETNSVRAETFAAPITGSIPTIVRSFKSAVTRAARAAFRKPSLDVWQRNYFERVIRSDDEFRKTWQYICENPARWDFDPENPQKQTRIGTNRPVRQ
ncbi:MAG: transposase [Candidatus Acidiferrales bacterium]